MTLTQANGSIRSLRHRGATFIALAAAVAFAVLGILVAPSAASAATFGISTPDGTLFSHATVTITGAKAIDSRVEVPSLVPGDDPYCVIPGAGEADSEAWSCSFDITDGSWPVSATEYPADAAATASTLSVTVRVLGAPVIDGADPQPSTGLVTGSGMPGAGILVTGTGPSAINQTCGTVQPSGYWSCALAIPSGGTYSITAQQSWPGSGEPGGTSAPKRLIVDKTPPALPAFNHPSAGDRITAQPIAYSGSGEDGARVDVFIDGNFLCSASVAGSSWSCSAAGVPNGQHNVQAIQWDVAGNPSGATSEMTVTFASPSTPGNPGAGGGTETVAPIPSPTTPGSPSPAPTWSSPQLGFPYLPPPIGGDSGLPPGDTWGIGTDYGAALPSVADSTPLWPLGALLAVGFILLVALPLRLVVGALRGRFPVRQRRLAGRNRDDIPDSDEAILPPWVAAAGTLGAAVLFAALAAGVQAEVRYLRLAIAIGIALVVLGAVGVWFATKASSRALGQSTGMRLVPMFLVLGAVTALVSRTGGIQPPVIVGVVVGATFAATMPSRSRGIVALSELGAITVLGLAAWLGHSAVGDVDGFGPLLASETLAALCIASLGSVMVLVLPVSSMPGRQLFEWSRPGWLATALVAGTLAATVIGAATTFPRVLAVGVEVVFAVLCVAIWSWVRYVEPQLLGRERDA